MIDIEKLRQDIYTNSPHDLGTQEDSDWRDLVDQNLTELPAQLTEARRTWHRIARENGWDQDPLPIQLFIDRLSGRVLDSVSFIALEEDTYYLTDDDYDEDL